MLWSNISCLGTFKKSSTHGPHKHFFLPLNPLETREGVGLYTRIDYKFLGVKSQRANEVVPSRGHDPLLASDPRKGNPI